MNRQTQSENQKTNIDLIFEQEKISNRKKDQRNKKSKLKKLSIAGILFSLGIVGVAIIGNQISQEEDYTEYTIENASNLDSEEARVVTIDGTEFSLPIKVQDLLDIGFEQIPRYEDAELLETVDPDTSSYIALGKGNEVIDFVVVDTPKRDVVSVEDSLITSFSIESEDVEFSCLYGLEIGDDYETVEEVLDENGIGYILYINDDFRAYHGKFDVNDTKSSILYFDIYVSDGEVYEIYESYYD